MIEVQRHVSLTVLLVGILCLLGSLWLAGRTFTEARRRSLLTAILIFIPATAVIASLYWSGMRKRLWPEDSLLP